MRIFPTARQDKPLEAKEVLSTINYENLPGAIADIRSGKHETQLDDLLKVLLSEKSQNSRLASKDEDDDENDFTGLEDSHVHDEDETPSKGKFAKTSDNECNKPEKGKFADTDNDDESEDDDDEEGKDNGDDDEVEADADMDTEAKSGEENEKRKGVFSDTKRVIRFTSPEQISARALNEAQAVNDQVLVRAILSARNDRRVAVAKKIVETTSTQMQKEARINTKTTKQVAAAAKKEDAQTTKPKTVASTTTPKSRNGFKTVDKMSTAEKNLFALTAKESGLPEAYIQACFGVKFAEAEDSSHVKAIKSVMASKMDAETKKAAVTAMIKTSMLDKESENRVIHYWKDELHYQDTEWIKALVEDYKAE